ncbi:MAG: transcriptional regulator [Frankiales bacterium]|nr:transcriptional regulator [Frankiales bacterium]
MSTPGPTDSTTREQVLAVALELFTVQGYDGTSLRQIAERLGFTKAALYYHFPAKDSLVIELTRPWLDAVSNLIALSHAGDGGVAERDRLLADYLDVFISHHAVLRFLNQDAGAHKHPDVGKRAQALVEALRQALTGPDADAAARVRVACALGVIHAVAGLDPAALPEARDTVLEAACTVLHGSPPAG